MAPLGGKVTLEFDQNLLIEEKKELIPAPYIRSLGCEFKIINRS